MRNILKVYYVTFHQRSVGRLETSRRIPRMRFEFWRKSDDECPLFNISNAVEMLYTANNTPMCVINSGSDAFSLLSVSEARNRAKTNSLIEELVIYDSDSVTAAKRWRCHGFGTLMGQIYMSRHAQILSMNNDALSIFMNECAEHREGVSERGNAYTRFESHTQPCFAYDRLLTIRILHAHSLSSIQFGLVRFVSNYNCWCLIVQSLTYSMFHD